jgi:hypothetical protein
MATKIVLLNNFLLRPNDLKAPKDVCSSCLAPHSTRTYTVPSSFSKPRKDGTGISSTTIVKIEFPLCEQCYKDWQIVHEFMEYAKKYEPSYNPRMAELFGPTAILTVATLIGLPIYYFYFNQYNSMITWILMAACIISGMLAFYFYSKSFDTSIMLPLQKEAKTRLKEITTATPVNVGEIILPQLTFNNSEYAEKFIEANTNENPQIFVINEDGIYLKELTKANANAK